MNEGSASRSPARLVLDLLQLSGLLRTSIDRLGRPLALTATRLQVLDALHREPSTVSQVARAVGMSRQSVRLQVVPMQRAGWLAYEPNPANRRASLVRLTPTGLASLQQACRLLEQAGGAESDALDPAAPSLQALAQLQRRLMTAARRPGEPAR